MPTEKQFREIVERIEQVERAVAGVVENNKMTSEMYDIFKSVQGGFRVLGFIGRITKPLLAIGAFFTALWIYHRTGKWPSL